MTALPEPGGVPLYSFLGVYSPGGPLWENVRTKTTTCGGVVQEVYQQSSTFSTPPLPALFFSFLIVTVFFRAGPMTAPPPPFFVFFVEVIFPLHHPTTGTPVFEIKFPLFFSIDLGLFQFSPFLLLSSKNPTKSTPLPVHFFSIRV